MLMTEKNGLEIAGQQFKREHGRALERPVEPGNCPKNCARHASTSLPPRSGSF